MSELNSAAPHDVDSICAERDALKQLVEAQQIELNKLDELERTFKAEREEYNSKIESLQTIGLKYQRLVCLYNDLARYVDSQSINNTKILTLQNTVHGKQLSGEARVMRGCLQDNRVSKPIFFSKTAFSNPDGSLLNLADKEVESDKFVSFEHGFVYFAVPKVASQSVLRALKTYCKDGKFLHSRAPLSTIINEAPEVAQFFKFSVVRQPFNRLVSCYIDKVLDVTFDIQRMLNRSTMERFPTAFPDFLEYVASCPDREANAHWASQTGVLVSIDGSMLVDAVAHLENLEEELSYIFNHIGLSPLNFNKVKNTRSQHLQRTLEEFSVNKELFDNAFFWTKQIEEKVQERFKSDYQNFGYLPLDTATLSIIICSHNRRDLLRECLQAIAEQFSEIDAGRIEVVVVDNCSEDGTDDFLKDLAKEVKWLRFVRENNLGLSHARNCGANFAHGNYLCYLDDDAKIGEGYLKSIFQVIDEHQPDILGGPVYPFYTSTKPFWFQDALEIRKYANRSGFSDCSISGGNFTIRADLLKQLGLFSTEYGLIGTELRLGEERELLERYQMSTPSAEQRSYYSLECFIYHHVPAKKMTLGYFTRRAFESGRMKAMLSNAFSDIKSRNRDMNIKPSLTDSLRHVIFGKNGIFLPIRVLHRLAFIFGILVQKMGGQNAKGNR